MRRAVWVAVVMAVGCAEPHWEHDVVVEVRLENAPEGALAAVERAVLTYAEVVGPWGVGVSMSTRAPGDIIITWAARRPGSVGETDMRYGASGGMDRATITLSADLVWSTGEECGEGFDLEAATVHELGHAFGLWHSTDRRAVMFPEVPPCPEPKRSLGVDDLIELGARYR
jgi:hypothetical protein